MTTEIFEQGRHFIWERVNDALWASIRDVIPSSVRNSVWSPMTIPVLNVTQHAVYYSILLATTDKIKEL